jgi:hypothetical protein
MATQEQLDALKALYYSGVLEVKHGDNTVKYASMADMRKAISELELQLSGRSRVSYPAFTRD